MDIKNNKISDYRYGDQIQGTRPQQEDCYAVCNLPDGGSLLVLADGMGGHSDGEKASACIVNSITGQFQRAANPVQLSLLQVAENANEQLAEAKAKGAIGRDAGCTLILVRVYNGVFDFLSIGDSYLLFQPVGQGMQQCNQLHTVAAEMAATGATKEEIAATPKSKALTCAVVGKAFSRTPYEGRNIPLAPGDRLILASDGLLTLSLSRIDAYLRQDAVRPEGDARGLVDTLLRCVELKKRTKQDNTTVVCYQQPPAGVPAATATHTEFTPRLPVLLQATRPLEVEPEEPYGHAQYSWRAVVAASVGTLAVCGVCMASYSLLSDSPPAGPFVEPTVASAPAQVAEPERQQGMEVLTNPGNAQTVEESIIADPESTGWNGFCGSVAALDVLNIGDETIDALDARKKELTDQGKKDQADTIVASLRAVRGAVAQLDAFNTGSFDKLGKELNTLKSEIEKADAENAAIAEIAEVARSVDSLKVLTGALNLDSLQFPPDSGSLDALQSKIIELKENADIESLKEGNAVIEKIAEEAASAEKIIGSLKSFYLFIKKVNEVKNGLKTQDKGVDVQQLVSALQDPKLQLLTSDQTILSCSVTARQEILESVEKVGSAAFEKKWENINLIKFGTCERDASVFFVADIGGYQESIFEISAAKENVRNVCIYSDTLKAFAADSDLMNLIAEKLEGLINKNKNNIEYWKNSGKAEEYKVSRDVNEPILDFLKRLCN